MSQFACADVPLRFYSLVSHFAWSLKVEEEKLSYYN